MSAQRLLGWLIILLIVAFSLWALWVAVGGVGAQGRSIEDCVLDSSPYDHRMIAVQWPGDAVWAIHWYEGEIVELLTTARPDVSSDHARITTEGRPLRRWFLFTDTTLREAWEFRWLGGTYLFIFGDARLPGVRVETRPLHWDRHGACVVQLTTAPDA